ncbi:MAG: hypothetical protein QXM31_03550 [Candidatus Woesearchaeota archaeon]
MRKFIALLVLLMLAACASEKPIEPAAPAEPAAQPAQAEAVAPEPAAEEEARPAPADGLAERLAREQAEKIAESIEHVQKLPLRERKTIVSEMMDVYSTLDSYKFKSSVGTFFVRGNKVRIILRTPINKRIFTQGSTRYPEIFVDEVILDRVRKEATGYCFGFTEKVTNECANLKLFDTPFNLSYDEIAVKMPDEWLAEYLHAEAVEEEHEKYFINSIETIRVRFKDGTEMYFFPRAGLPVKVVKGPLELFEYENIVPNQARPEDVIHRSRESIPATELFYKQIY